MRTFALTAPAAIAKLPLLQQSTRPEGWRQCFDAQIFLLGAEFTKVYANAHGSVAGAKALAATKATAAAAKAGTDDPGAALQAPALAAAAAAKTSDVPDYAALQRTAEAQKEIDQRVRVATAALARQAAVFALTTLASVLLSRLQRRQRKQMRRRRDNKRTLATP